MVKYNIKRQFYVTDTLAAAWEDFHSPSKDYSPNGAGAMLVWMVLPADVRETIRKLAAESTDISDAQDKALAALKDSLLNRQIVLDMADLDVANNDLLAVLEQLKQKRDHGN